MVEKDMFSHDGKRRKKIQAQRPETRKDGFRLRVRAKDISGREGKDEARCYKGK